VVEQLSPREARRIALGAQGFGRAHPPTAGRARIEAVLHRLRVLQIDSVNVFERSHYVPVFARLGAYDRTLLDRLLFTSHSRYVEYLAHVACFIPVEAWPLFRWRMDAYRDKHAADGWVQANGEMLDWLRAELADKGPMAASEIEHDANVRRGPWWGWSDVKEGLEYLFWWGEVTSAGRSRFERRYALTEHVLEPAILSREVARDDAHRELLRRATAALGVGTARDLADYYRLKGPEVTAALRDLEDEGEIVPVHVRGWERNGRPTPAWRHRDARIPRRIDGAALLSPFDPVVWERSRTERMFGFHYRIEIYTPEPKRRFGYYVLPFMLRDGIVARVDLKADRANGLLLARAAHAEPGAPADVATELAAELRLMAEWLQLDGVVVSPSGDLAPGLAEAVARTDGAVSAVREQA
jgi:uncharacterized protein YcaQ